VGSGRRKARQTTKKYKHGGQRRGHSFSNADRTDPATQKREEAQRAGPPRQLLHRWSETSDRVLTAEGGLWTVQNATATGRDVRGKG